MWLSQDIPADIPGYLFVPYLPGSLWQNCHPSPCPGADGGCWWPGSDSNHSDQGQGTGPERPQGPGHSTARAGLFCSSSMGPPTLCSQNLPWPDPASTVATEGVGRCSQAGEPEGKARRKEGRQMGRQWRHGTRNNRPLVSMDLVAGPPQTPETTVLSPVYTGCCISIELIHILP
jgi:hypothetical protein